MLDTTVAGPCRSRDGHDVSIIDEPADHAADPPTIGGRIRKARRAKGWLQADLAQRTDIREATISRYETGAYVPSRDALMILAQVLEVDLAWLACHDNPPAESRIELDYTSETQAAIEDFIRTHPFARGMTKPELGRLRQVGFRGARPIPEMIEASAKSIVAERTTAPAAPLQIDVAENRIVVDRKTGKAKQPEKSPKK